MGVNPAKEGGEVRNIKEVAEEVRQARRELYLKSKKDSSPTAAKEYAYKGREVDKLLSLIDKIEIQSVAEDHAGIYFFLPHQQPTLEEAAQMVLDMNAQANPDRAKQAMKYLAAALDRED